MLNTNGIFNLLAATAALAAQDGDEMTARVLGLLAAGPATDPALPLALRYAQTASEGSPAPRVRSALQALLGATESAWFAGFKVRLVDHGGNKITAIKAVRELANLDLGAAKSLVEGAPSDVKVFERRASAEEAMAKLEAIGCRVELTPVARAAW